MSSVSTLAKSRPQRGWFRQRYRETLSLAAFDGMFSSRSRKISGFQAAELARSTVVNCNTTIFNGRLPLHSVLCQPFNTHRAGIVERSAQSVFSASARHSASIRSQRTSAPRRYG
jgi:hypothetical protein